MSVTVRTLAVGGVRARKAAQILGQQALRVGGTLHKVFGGYLLRATVANGRATVTIIDAPVWLVLCQPYLIDFNGITPFVCRVVRLRRGYDAVRVDPTPRLTYSASSPDADVTSDDLLYRWFLGMLPVGNQPTAAVALYTRGVYTPNPISVAMPHWVTDTPDKVSGVWPTTAKYWLRIQHMSIGQRIYGLNASLEDVLPTSEKQLAHFQIASDAITGGAWSAPLNDIALLGYTVLPSVVSIDRRNGVAFCHTFRGVNPPTSETGQYNAELQSGLSLARYTVVGEIGDTDTRVASISWRDTVWPDQYAPILNREFTRTGITRGALVGTSGLVVAAVSAPDGVSTATPSRGAVAISFDAGAGVTSVDTVAAHNPAADAQVYYYAPLLGVETSAGPRVACIRARGQIVDSVELRQNADDIDLVLVAPGGGEVVVDLGGYFPHTYLTTSASFSGGRIAMGVSSYPVESGDWQITVVQPMCLCAPDTLAVVVRPSTQFNTGTTGVTDIHVALVDALTGAVKTVRPVPNVQVDGTTSPLQMSLWNHASLTCLALGEWVNGEETKPPRLMLNIFREGGAPVGVVAPPIGTYISPDGGATFNFLVNMGASLVYSLGSALETAALAPVTSPET